MINKELETDYWSRLNRVFIFIDNNLGSDLSLDSVSSVALFSPFHFHRIFKYITGETLNAYVTRKRLEKSALHLLHDHISITSIAHKCGFNDVSSFSRAFKKFYGVSPTQFKKQNPYRHSKIGQLKSKNRQQALEEEKYICVIENLKNWIKMNAKIEIKEMPKMELAYVSSIGVSDLVSAYGKLIKWAKPNGLMTNESKMVTIYHDSFKVTEPNKVRMSACILLKELVETDGDIGITTIERGKFIVGSFEIGLDEFEKSWTSLFLWMNENGYTKADKNPFEIYHNNFNDHPERKAVVDFYIPIESGQST